MFSRVYRLEWWYSQSCWYFRLVLWTIAPLTFSLVSTLPPFPVWISILTYTECKGKEGVLGHRRGDRQIKHLPQSPFTGKFLLLRVRFLIIYSLPHSNCTKCSCYSYSFVFYLYFWQNCMMWLLYFFISSLFCSYSLIFFSNLQLNLMFFWLKFVFLSEHIEVNKPK